MRRSFRIQPYGARLTVVKSDRGEALNTALRRHGLPSGGIPQGAYAVSFQDNIGKEKDKARWVVALPHNVAPWVLAHEATHVALQMAQWYDVKVDHDNDEPIAYLVGHITWLLGKR